MRRWPNIALALFGFGPSLLAQAEEAVQNRWFDSYFLRGDAGQSYFLSRPKDTKGGFNKVTWGLHAGEFFHGLTGVFRRFYNYKPDVHGQPSYRIESEAVGLDEEWHHSSFILGGSVEGGRLWVKGGDVNNRHSFKGASLYLGYAVFTNQYLHFSFKVGACRYIGNKSFEEFDGQRPFDGGSISFGINLNDSHTDPIGSLGF